MNLIPKLKGINLAIPKIAFRPHAESIIQFIKKVQLLKTHRIVLSLSFFRNREGQRRKQ